MNPVNIIIADDQLIFREGLKLVLKKFSGFHVIAEYQNGMELIEGIRQQIPHVVLTDSKMPVMDGIEACKKIKEEFPNVPVISLSMFNDDYLILDMLEAGARGYLGKNVEKEELHKAIITVLEGDTYFGNDTSSKLARMLAESKFNPFKHYPVTRFSERECSIIKLICQQKSNKEIADILNLSFRTVETHRENIQEKTGARNSIGIVIYAIRHNLFHP